MISPPSIPDRPTSRRTASFIQNQRSWRINIQRLRAYQTSTSSSWDRDDWILPLSHARDNRLEYSIRQSNLLDLSFETGVIIYKPSSSCKPLSLPLGMAQCCIQIWDALIVVALQANWECVREIGPDKGKDLRCAYNPHQIYGCWDQIEWPFRFRWSSTESNKNFKRPGTDCMPKSYLS